MGQKLYLISISVRLALLALLIAVWAGAPMSLRAADDDATLASGLEALVAHADASAAALGRGDLAEARAAFTRFDDGWFDIEDGVRDRSRQAYRSIEGAMDDVRFGLRPDQPDVPTVQADLTRLHQEVMAFVGTLGSTAPGTASPRGATTATAPAGSAPTPATLVQILDRLSAALDRGDVAAARTEVRTFQDVWLDVEGSVKTRSRTVYTDTENRTAEVAAALARQPADVEAARRGVSAMRADLVPVVQAGATYGMWDAAIILFREGFEALLVVAALVAFLQRSGNADKRGWIWAGGAAGILASIGVALVAHAVLDRAAANVSREVMEGAIGLVAAAMLLYVGYWLHSKASLAGWQEYIREQSTAALKRNSLLGLAFIAFLAVFREGAETVLFYLGIAPGISTPDLLLGLGVGAAGLVVLALIMLVAGVRLPVRPFFLAATVLIYYLCLKFVGSGVHALQVAGVVPATPASRVPSIELFGVYPTWETTLAQLAVVLLILGFELGPRLLHHGSSPAPAGQG
jgi:high-affinity iron transporter